jgi:hypothetical protein
MVGNAFIHRIDEDSPSFGDNDSRSCITITYYASTCAQNLSLVPCGVYKVTKTDCGDNMFSEPTNNSGAGGAYGQGDGGGGGSGTKTEEDILNDLFKEAFKYSDLLENQSLFNTLLENQKIKGALVGAGDWETFFKVLGWKNPGLSGTISVEQQKFLLLNPQYISNPEQLEKVIYILSNTESMFDSKDPVLKKLIDQILNDPDMYNQLKKKKVENIGPIVSSTVGICPQSFVLTPKIPKAGEPNFDLLETGILNLNINFPTSNPNAVLPVSYANLYIAFAAEHCQGDNPSNFLANLMKEAFFITSLRTQGQAVPYDGRMLQPIITSDQAKTAYVAMLQILINAYSPHQSKTRPYEVSINTYRRDGPTYKEPVTSTACN